MAKMNINKIVLGMLIICVILLVANLFYLKYEGVTCMTSPLIYGVEKISKTNNGEFMCDCSLDLPLSAAVHVNSTAIVVDRKRYGSESFMDFNLSELANLTFIK